MTQEAGSPTRVVGRYRLYREIAAGGMATVHLGRLHSAVGFSRTVAIKQLHAQFAKDPEFVAMFLDEARLAARIHHPNVVATLDVVTTDNEIFLVMDYVHGETLARLMRSSAEGIDPKIAAALIAGSLHGLHAAHEATTEEGAPLGIVHRDVSPQNVIVGVDGMPRVLDFGVAKAADRAQTTGEGRLKGKLRYMAPEQLRGQGVSRQTDVYAAAVVLHEMITGRPLFSKADPGAAAQEILFGQIPVPSSVLPSIPAALDAIVLRGLARDPGARYRDAHEMAMHLEEAIGLASASQVAAWVARLAGEAIASRASLVSQMERSSARLMSTTPNTEASVPPVRPASHSVTAPAVQTSAVAPPPERAPRAVDAATPLRVGLAIAALFIVSLTAVTVVRRLTPREPPPSAVSAPPPASSAETSRAAEAESARIATPPLPTPDATPSVAATTSVVRTATAPTIGTLKPHPPRPPPPSTGAAADDGMERTRR